MTDPALDPGEYPSLAKEAIATVHIRALHRHQEFYTDSEPRRVENCYTIRRYRDTVNAIFDTARNEPPWSLSFLSALSRLISDTDEFILYYAPYEWSKQKRFALSRAADADAVVVALRDLDPPQVTASEKYLLYKTIFSLEGYFQAKFYCGWEIQGVRRFYDFGPDDGRHGVNFSNIGWFNSDCHRAIDTQLEQGLLETGQEDQNVFGSSLLELSRARRAQLPPTMHGSDARLKDYIAGQGIQPLLRLMRITGVRDPVLDWVKQLSLGFLGQRYLARSPSALWDDSRMAKLQEHSDLLISQIS